MSSPLILKPYERRKPPGPFRRLLAGMGLVFLAAFYGLMCTILPMQLIVVPLVPILAMIGLILWLLPDTGGVREDAIANGMIWFVGLSVIWPSYVALNAPGLPLITPTRIALFGTLLVIAFNFATSQEMRSRVSDAGKSLPFARRMFWLFWLTTLVSLAFSTNIFFSINKFLNNQVYWTVLFAISAWLAMREGFTMRLAKVLTASVLLVALMALPEYRTQTPIWIPHLPSFLRIDPELIAQMSAGNARAGTNEYRLRGTFTGALYFAEFLAVTFPFVLHFWARQRTFLRFAVMTAAVFLMGTVMYLTGSRSAMLALVLSPLTYALLVAWRARLQNPNSIVASAAVYSYPMAAIGMALLVQFWYRLHVLVIGGGQHQKSTEAREIQWAMGWPKIGRHPFGHGAGRSGEVLGFYNPGSDNPTVDSYYLTLLLDYGALGLLFFLMLFAVVIWVGFRVHNKARTEEQKLLAPILASLANFVIIKSVASTEINMPIIFVLMGCVFGLAGRQAQMDAKTAAAPAPEPVPWHPAPGFAPAPA